MINVFQYAKHERTGAIFVPSSLQAAVYVSVFVKCMKMLTTTLLNVDGTAYIAFMVNGINYTVDSGNTRKWGIVNMTHFLNCLSSSKPCYFCHQGSKATAFSGRLITPSLGDIYHYTLPFLLMS